MPTPNVELTCNGDEICRLCISKIQVIDLFSKPKTAFFSNLTPILENYRYYEIAQILAEIEIQQNDQYSKGICGDCALKLIQFFSFKIQIEKSQKELEATILISENIEEIDLKHENMLSPMIVEKIEDCQKIDDEKLNENIEDFDFQEIESVQGYYDSTDKKIYIESDEYFEYIEERSFTKNSPSQARNFSTSTKKLSPEEQKIWTNKLNTWMKRQEQKEGRGPSKGQYKTAAAAAQIDGGFKCEHCDRVYKTKRSLDEHSYVHTGIMNYQCDECGRKFGRKSLLMSHIDVRHLKTKIFPCGECGKNFTRKNNLTTHQWIHQNIKRYTCKFCEKKFTWRSTLRQHLLVHTGERPFKCHLCEKDYTSDPSLRKHCRRNHNGAGIKPITQVETEKNYAYKQIKIE